MAVGRDRFRPGGRALRCMAGSAGMALALAAVFGVCALGACNPTIDAWRSLNGISKNDPDPQTAPFTKNMAEAEAAAYPNLASVPPPPTHATTTAERQKLTQSLIADRTATEAGAGPAVAPLAARSSAASKAAPAPAVAVAPAAPPPDVQSSAAPAVAAAEAPAAAPPGKVAPTSHRKPGEPPAPQPLESSLQMPQIATVPQPEAARPAPPPPVLPAVLSPGRLAEPAPAAIASAMPEPAPPVPVLAPIAPPPNPVQPPPRAPAPTTVATLEIGAAAAAPDAAERSQIERVAARYKEAAANVRVVAYAAAPAAGADPLASYRAALERAQAVARALQEAGIPANKIQTQAAPTAGGAADGRVEIQFAP